MNTGAGDLKALPVSVLLAPCNPPEPRGVAGRQLKGRAMVWGLR